MIFTACQPARVKMVEGARWRALVKEYSPDMIRLNRRGVKPTVRPSGHVIRSSFDKVGEGAIPGNVVEAPEAMLKFGNNAANDEYAKRTKELGLKMHPARFPSALPEFFVRLLTDEGDVVIDPFAGSNTTGVVSEILKRRWIAMEQKEQYLEASRVRFEQAPSEIADREKQTKLF